MLWDEPFTWKTFPILDYEITVSNDSEPASSWMYTKTEHHRLNMTQDTVMTACFNLIFKVSARNEIGISEFGNVTGGFPVGELIKLQQV